MTTVSLKCNYVDGEYNLDKAIRNKFGPNWEDNWVLLDWNTVKINKDSVIVEATFMGVNR